MALQIDATSILQNHRGLYFECIGDGAATTISVKHGRIIRPNMTVTAAAVVTSTAKDTTNSNWGGHPKHTGTNQALTSSVVNADGTITFTFTAAPTNAIRVFVNALHGADGLE